MNLQQLFLLGRSTRDAEVLESKEGKSYAKFSLAVNEFRQTGAERETYTQYYNVLVFGKRSGRAEAIKKGDLVMVDGRPDVDAYLSNDGEPKASLIVFADRFRIMK
ncbi:MAG: single-stranded DNA-binding protein [Candidatus Dojkabacteria bacterium]|uniref:Single-stranded DNA-binding protein n=2 Tax=Candidatus Dojkabacteria TaxID=74243 RepID=A0A136KH38_9BACT|nr:MAG: Single-stranded DNA-binding protein [candidate division WS6 bacterium OLB21]MBW7953696.1 single-stranded DNA-binding protein [Candidatus Dojkabacteria bacterium]WKZ28106.1 MAG: single-stranded DNA-binding protein [Candidatus Dojkabacteria bacterium]